MSKNIFEAFDEREKQVTEYMAGCGMKYGMPCTCGPGCRCKNCPIHGNSSDVDAAGGVSSSLRDTFSDSLLSANGNGNDSTQFHHDFTSAENAAIQAEIDAIQPIGAGVVGNDEAPLQIDQSMNLFGMGPPSVQVPQAPMAPANTGSISNSNQFDSHSPGQQVGQQHQQHHQVQRSPTRMSIGRSSMRMSLQQRNPSVLSYGNGLRHMSMTSETTFGRAMSGLSALSIDWENLDDFDLDVDHSAHINNNGGGNNNTNGSKDNGGLRSSFRRSYVAPGSNPNNQQDDAHVSFKV